MKKRMQMLLCAGLCCLMTACAGKERAEEKNTEKETDGYVQVTGEQSEEETAGESENVTEPEDTSDDVAMPEP